MAAQKALMDDPSRATEIGQRLFPPDEAGLIEDLVRRDSEYYSAEIAPNMVASLNDFCRKLGSLDGDAAYDDVVAARFAHLWTEQ